MFHPLKKISYKGRNKWNKPRLVNVGKQNEMEP